MKCITFKNLVANYKMIGIKELIKKRQVTSALKFQHFLPWQIKCRGSCMKIHSTFLPRLVGFYIKKLCIYLGGLGKDINEK